MRRLSLLALILALASPPVASAAFAPIDRPGPKLRVAKEKLRDSVECSSDVRGADRTPVLLTPATAVDSENNFSWNYERLFAAEGIPYCTSDQFRQRSTNMSSLYVRGQYVTYAIRRVSRLAGRKIAVVGHSQGGMIMRLSLRFWPDTRRKVTEVIGFAGSNHGTDAARSTCMPDCAPSIWQQRSDSKYVAALNSRAETFAGIDYTEIYTENDSVVTPPESAGVSGPGRITNVAVQEICPDSNADHLSVGTIDPTAAALALDALDHRGPADPSRINASVCGESFQPGFDPITGPASLGLAGAQLASSLATFRHVSAEPRLRCWTKLTKKRCRRARSG